MTILSHELDEALNFINDNTAIANAQLKKLYKIAKINSFIYGRVFSNGANIGQFSRLEYSPAHMEKSMNGHPVLIKAQDGFYFVFDLIRQFPYSNILQILSKYSMCNPLIYIKNCEYHLDYFLFSTPSDVQPREIYTKESISLLKNFCEQHRAANDSLLQLGQSINHIPSWIIHDFRNVKKSPILAANTKEDVLKIHAREMKLSRTTSQDMFGSKLIQRELECVRLTSLSFTEKEIATIISCSTHTVAIHLERAINKLGLGNVHELIESYIDNEEISR